MSADATSATGDSFLGDLARAAAVLVAYRPVEFAVMRAYGLPEESYAQPVILWELLEWLQPFPVASIRDVAWALCCAAALVLLYVGRRIVFGRWSDLDHGTALRTPITIFALTSAWGLATYDYNLYFDQAHYGDRILVIALAALVWVKPIFVVPFAFEAAAVMGQFQHPLHGYYPTHVILPVRLLMLFAGALALRAAGVRLKARDFVYVALAFVAAGYFQSGVGKLELGWLSHGHTYNILFATYANGWANFLTPEQVSAIGRTLASLDPLMTAGVLLLEIGVLGMFWRRTTAAGLLLLGAAFHVAVLALSGIFFWIWIVVDLTLGVWLLTRAGRAASDFFTPRHFLASLALIPLATAWMHPTGLSWLDVPVNYTYRFAAIGESGRRYSLAPSFFAPYQYEFTVGSFDAWVRQRMLRIRYGAVSDPQLGRQLLAVRTAQDVELLESRLGEVRFDEEVGRGRDRFIARWMRRYYERGGKRTWLSAIRAPLGLNTLARENAYRGEEPVCSVEVERITSLFDGKRYNEFGAIRARSIDVTDSAACRERPGSP